MRRWLIWLCLALLGFASPALADDKADCNQATDIDRAIVGCSHIISSRRATSRDIAQAYFSRGADYFNKGQYDLGLADESKAIALNPQLAYAYLYRGTRDRRQRQHALALLRSAADP